MATAFIRKEPENTRLSRPWLAQAAAALSPGQISGVVKSVLFKGVHYEMMIDTGETVFKVHSTVMQPQGSRVGINIVPFNIHIMKPMPKEAPKDV